MAGPGHQRNLHSSTVAARVCLGPRGPHLFISAGNWNRICTKCAQAQGLGPTARFAPTRERRHPDRAGSHDARTG